MTLRQIPLRRGCVLVLTALCFVASTSLTWSQTAPPLIPKKGDPGWDVTQVDDKPRPAPSGYEGRTEGSTLTAVGNAPETAGKKIVARFEISNAIKTCPNAAGTAEGDGIFSLTVDSTDTQPTGISRLHVDMRAVGKYKGEVGDDAWVKNPVKAEIDYTFRISGGVQERRGGAIATPAGADVPQQFTFPFSVGGTMEAPKIGAFSGGDPTKGHYSEARSAATALVYWAGVYYSIAQTKWRDPGTCVAVSFTPPSNTEKLIPGGRTTVRAEVKTKAGEGVKARFLNAHGYDAGAGVSPTEGPSDVGAPITFTFVAPPQKLPKSGFAVGATSRAGVANGEWFAGLGTDWSGRISLTITNTGDAGENELQTWSNSSATRMTIEVKDGKGTARATTEKHSMSARRQKALRGGSVIVIPDSSESIDGSIEDESPASVQVLNPSAGAYAIRVSAVFTKMGTAHVMRCDRNRGCRADEQPMVVEASGPGIDGKTDDPNRLRGSKTEVGRGSGYQGKGTITTTITWDLARQGKGQ